MSARVVSHMHFACAVLSSDDAFDAQFPRGVQIKAFAHFTPIEVARKAAILLAPHDGMSVLDVGAGAGKFCLAAALAVPTATFVGVELRGHLVRIASHLATQHALQNVRFIHGDAFDLDWSQFDSFYLYNPFAEQLFESAFALDRSIALDPENFVAYVTAVRRRLAHARVGTRLVTYHGFGGTPPLGYDLAFQERVETDRVELWIKTRAVAVDVALDEAA